MFFASLLILAGGAFLYKGAQLLVHGSSTIALRLRVPPLIIGLTVVAFGTSAPELFLSHWAAVAGQPLLAIGNILGSNVANILLILGCAAVAGPVLVPRSTLLRDLPILALATAFVALLANDRWFSFTAANLLSARDGLLLLGLFAVFLYALLLEKGMDGMRLIEHFRFRHAYRVSLIGRHSMPRAALETAASVFVLALGAALFVRGAGDLGTALHLPEELVGLTVAALGTALPELATTLVAAWRGEAEIAVGNVVGSNIFNTLFVLGTVAVVSPLPWSSTFNVDLAIHAAAIALVVGVLWHGRRRREISRGEGAFLIVAYLVYVAILFGRFS